MMRSCTQITLLVCTLFSAVAPVFSIDVPTGYTIVLQRYSQEMWLQPNATISVEDIVDAASQIVPAFNALMKNKNDPFDRQLISVNVSSIEFVEDGIWQTISLIGLDNRRRLGRNSGKVVNISINLVGSCSQCDSIVAGNSKSGRRHLRALKADVILDDAELVIEQNLLINNSNNPIVASVGDLYAEAISAAEEAKIAAINAQIALAYVEDLKIKFEQTTEEIKAMTEVLKQQEEDLENDLKKLMKVQAKDNKRQQKKVERRQGQVDDLKKKIKENEDTLKILEDKHKNLDNELKKATGEANKTAEEAEKAANRASSAEQDLLEFLAAQRELAESIALSKNEDLVSALVL